VQQAEIDGGGSNPLHSEVIDARGFSGSTVLVGGGGGGTIYGGSGNDDIITGTGGYSVFDALGQNIFHTRPGDLVFGLANRTLSNAELSQTGALMVSLQGDRVVFNGPSGGGFTIQGTWQTGADSQGHEYFQATSTTLSLQTALGSLTIPNAPQFPLTVITKLGAVSGGGIFDSLSVGQGGLNLGLSDPTGPLAPFLNTFGLNLSIPGRNSASTWAATSLRALICPWPMR